MVKIVRTRTPDSVNSAANNHVLCKYTVFICGRVFFSSFVSSLICVGVFRDPRPAAQAKYVKHDTMQIQNIQGRRLCSETSLQDAASSQRACEVESRSCAITTKTILEFARNNFCNRHIYQLHARK
jgi:hypothetical protein